MSGMYFLPSSSSLHGGQSHFLISNPKHCQSQNHNQQILQRNPESEFQTHHDQAAAWSGKADVDLKRMQWKRGGFNLWVDPVVQVKGEKLGAPPYSQLAKLISVLVKRFFSGWPRKWLCFQTSFWSVFQTAISGQTRDNFKEGFPKISLKMETCVGAGRVKEGGQD